MSEVNTSDIRKAIGEVVANSKSEEYVLKDEFGGGIMRTVADVAVFTPTSINWMDGNALEEEGLLDEIQTFYKKVLEHLNKGEGVVIGFLD